jgi:2,4-dichlorophenol 6-monooxygenase
MISTLDLCGKGKFTLLTGIGGQGWKNAAAEVSKVGFDIRIYIIGPGYDYHDGYFKWSEHREVDENGANLLRPDLFVEWRANEWVEGKGMERLTKAMWKIPGYGKEGK